ncbi:DNA repair protein rad50 [Mortierella alpina]|uniref:DNA repair protein RAD50 n=1 Tax=Mortierella alpina TaxID=64518 RepID=A0A9P6JBX7_MORAP|nr:DNA repair protein rad50 [Mortierella alpina]
MSSIEKLMIRGIRSFEAEGGEAATITFYSPLTLITGHNGSGKTTIIECLKYATSGDLPPGSKGGAFVNDPKMSDSPSIKAQVRLRFKNVNHQQMSIIRSLSVTVKKSSYTQKTLENVLAAVDPQTGELATVSSKCAEIDADVPNHLGVSRAILDNVIFCHQEESNWPLSEPSILKKKFDDIFASTKYTNVLDSIKNIRKEKAQDLKVMHASLEFLRRNKEKAEKIREALAKNVESIETSQQRIDQLEIDINECAEQVSRLMEKTRELQAIEATLNALSHEHKAAQGNVRELEGTFTLYSESDAELQEMLFKHDLSLRTADQEKGKQERLKQKAGSAIANLQTSVNNNQQSIGQLKAVLESHKKKQADRDHLISELARLYSFDGFDSLPLVGSDIVRFVNKMELLVQQKSRDIEHLKSENRAKEQEIRSELAGKKARVDLSSSLKAKNQSAISSAQAKMRQYKQELSKHQTLEADITSTEALLAEQGIALAALRSSDPGLERMESQKRSKMADIEAFENELSRLSEQSSIQIKNAGAQARLTLLKNKHSQRTEQIKSTMKENNDRFQAVLNETPNPETVEERLQSILKEREVAVRRSREALERYKRERSSYDIRIESIKASLEKHAGAVEDCERKVAAECQDSPLPDLLAAKEEAVAELREQVQDIKTMSTMYGRFAAMAEKKHACPLCSRGFEPPLEAQFTAKLRRLMEKVENDDERELAALETTVNTLRSLKSVWDQAQNLKSKEIPLLKKQLEELQEQRSSAIESLESADLDAATASTELEDMQLLVSVSKNISALLQENIADMAGIQELETELLCAGSLQSSEEIQAEYNTIKQKMQIARQELNKLNQDIAHTTAEIQRKEQAIRSLTEKRNQLLNQRHRQSQINEQVAEIEESIRTLTAEMEQNEDESQNVMPDLNRLNEQLRQVTAEGHAKEMTMQQAVSELQGHLGKVQMYIKDLERVDARATMTELSKLEAVTDKYIEEIQEHREEVQAAENQMQVLQEQLSEFKSLQRNIDDNLRYRRYKAKQLELETQIAEVNSKKNSEVQGTYTRQLNRLSQRQSDLTAERAGLKGELRQLQDQKRLYEGELGGEYKDVVQNYHDSLIGYKTTELALQDLEKYAKALQSAIVEYHTMKMEEINKTIKELWTNTYRGTDIDTIEIRSDQEGLRANQTYNYRVVMIQRGRALDMRGRCSAGQKVLASIIIRLALAESFSLNCGILALDEPTTNLDEANVSQLAASLRLIIERHRQQSNFQLIIITHDESFLKMLSLTDYVDYYYKVQKNAEQYSTIRKLPVTES